MSYDYSDRRAEVFLEENQSMFLKIRDRIDCLISTAGACTIERAIEGTTGDSWTMIACVDRLAELGEIKIHDIGNRAHQHKIITR